ncbi:MAG: hypothetical protein KatS3mg011_1667 [Acidimicrobiia bacterium]|nr:MAG: hypothetical protein KatS3mg011_1667 [Acidimicrobiia bacterium]
MSLPGSEELVGAPPVFAILCDDHDTPLPPKVEGARLFLAGGLCGAPVRIQELPLDGGDGVRLVLGLHPGEFELGAVQTALRRIGVDPLGVEIVDLPAASGSADRLTTLLAGAVARVRRFPGATPEETKLRIPGAFSRRALLRMEAPVYIGAPRIDPQACVAGTGCHVCVPACPAGALTFASGSIAYDKETCIACGICVTTCTTGAVRNPTAVPEGVADQIAAYVRTSQDPAVGVVYICRDGAIPPLPEGMYPVRVPCTGMLTVGWLLAPLTMGAGTVVALPCGTVGCGLGNEERLAGVVGDAATILGVVEAVAGRVGHRLVGPPSPPLPDLEMPEDAFGPAGEAAVVAALASSLAAPEAEIALGSARLGWVTIDEAVCTACTRCAQVCPTDALAHRDVDGTIEIDFDPMLCVACGTCVEVCPESGANELWRGLRWPDLVAGPQVLRRETTATCEVCGGPIAPSAMLDRIAAMLGDEHAATLKLISRRCLRCR